MRAGKRRKTKKEGKSEKGTHVEWDKIVYIIFCDVYLCACILSTGE